MLDSKTQRQLSCEANMILQDVTPYHDELSQGIRHQRNDGPSVDRHTSEEDSSLIAGRKVKKQPLSSPHEMLDGKIQPQLSCEVNIT
jgi:hypothetical protein